MEAEERKKEDGLKKAGNHDHYVVCDAGSKEVNGIYKNLDGNSNDNTLNYKLVKGNTTFKLYRSPSEDQSVRYWIIEERNKDYFYLAVCKENLPPKTGWTPYIAGKATPPEVTPIPREVEAELRTRIGHKDVLSTLDLTNEYGSFCPLENLKRAYRVLWEEQPPEVRKEVLAEQARKKKKHVGPTVKRKIQLTIQVGVGPPEVTKQSSFQLSISFDAIVNHLKETIAKRQNLTGDNIQLMFKGHKILSNQASLASLGIEKGATVIALGITNTPKKAAGGKKSTSSLPVLDEDQGPPESPKPEFQSQVPDGKQKSCAIM